VALKYFAKYLQHEADEEREHAQKLINYQNLRGGRVLLQDVKVKIFLLDIWNMSFSEAGKR
jgi:ferritin